MNIFYLDHSPRKIAQWLCDKHIVKMTEESAQMLSTAHRVLDGDCSKIRLVSGESLVGSTIKNQQCYRIAHQNHPSTVWTRASNSNYKWHFDLFVQMLNEYYRRYARNRTVSNYLEFLSEEPKNISLAEYSEPPQALPDIYRSDSAVDSYRAFYVGEKWRFCKWKHQTLPEWFIPKMLEVWKQDMQSKIMCVAKEADRKTKRLDRRILSIAVELSRAHLQTSL